MERYGVEVWHCHRFKGRLDGRWHVDCYPTTMTPDAFLPVHARRAGVVGEVCDDQGTSGWLGFQGHPGRSLRRQEVVCNLPALLPYGVRKTTRDRSSPRLSVRHGVRQ